MVGGVGTVVGSLRRRRRVRLGGLRRCGGRCRCGRRLGGRVIDWIPDVAIVVVDAALEWVGFEESGENRRVLAGPHLDHGVQGALGSAPISGDH